MKTALEQHRENVDADLQEVAAAELDGMPHEVATSMLTTPKTKLTNRMRKNCLSARCKVFTSETPLLRPDPEKGYHVASPLKQPPKTLDDKLLAKLSQKNGLQLLNILARAKKRRARIQKQWVKLDDSKPKEGLPEGALKLWEKQKVLGLQLLDAAANRLEVEADTAEAVLAKRQGRKVEQV